MQQKQAVTWEKARGEQHLALADIIGEKSAPELSDLRRSSPDDVGIGMRR